MHLLRTPEEVNILIASGNPVLIYIHSTQCDMSKQASKEIEQFIPAANNTHVVQVNVPEDKQVSDHIAEKLGVKHESPQAILVKNKEVLWCGDQFDITVENLKAANHRTMESI